MNTVILWLGVPLGAIMRMCYSLFANYGAAILLFTLISKLILLPVGVYVHKNSIKIVRLQPELNRLKIRFFGDGDALADAQAALYKKEKYHPLFSLLPLAIQIVLLMGLVEVIYHPLSYLTSLPADTIERLCAAAADMTGADAHASSIQLRVLEALRDPDNHAAFMALGGTGLGWEETLQGIAALNTSFLSIDLGLVPAQTASLWFVPVIAGLSAFILCQAQNRMNVLQSEQGKLNKYGTMALSVGLSLYLGCFVPCGLALYWIASNLFAVVQLLCLNKIISPKKYVDYQALNESREKLRELNALGARPREEARALSKRERADYKRFFSVANKHIVFYSEGGGFYKYFEAIIRELLARTNLNIHYVTSDPNDAIFALASREPRILPYYIGEKKLITLFMKMDADVVVMTMSDLDNYHYKRSYVSKDVEYVYVFHYPLSTHMVLHTGALDHYDTVLCVGDFQIAEIRAQEKLYGTKEKKLVPCGYGQLEKLYADYEAMEKPSRERKKVLIAPSWQKDNILDTCIDDLLNALLKRDFDVVVRPHPEYMKRYRSRMEEIMRRWAHQTKGLTFETDFTSNRSIFDSDVVVTDWSGTAYEFSFVTLKPCVFIDTPPKINNPDYVKIGIEPLEFALRDKIGIRLDPKDLSGAAESIAALLSRGEQYAEEILSLRDTYIAHFGHSGRFAARYLIDTLKEHAARHSNDAANQKQ